MTPDEYRAIVARARAAVEGPTALRALAARVEVEAPSLELQEAIARALGRHQVTDCQGWWTPPGSYIGGGYLPEYLTSIDAAAAPMPDGWLYRIGHKSIKPHCVFYALGNRNPRTEHSAAPTEPQARAALALRCRAADLEQEVGQ